MTTDTIKTSDMWRRIEPDDDMGVMYDIAAFAGSREEPGERSIALVESTCTGAACSCISLLVISTEALDAVWTPCHEDGIGVGEPIDSILPHALPAVFYSRAYSPVRLHSWHDERTRLVSALYLPGLIHDRLSTGFTWQDILDTDLDALLADADALQGLAHHLHDKEAA